MAELEEFSVSDLKNMSAEEFRSKGFIKLKDPNNLTEEQIEEFRLLVNGIDESRGLDLGAVNDKLCNLAETAPTSPRSRSCPSPTPDANDPIFREELRQEHIRGEHKAHYDLIQDGGRPSHRPDDSGSEYLNELPNRTDIISYWTTICHGVENILQQQWWHWEKFREHQDWRRRRYWKPEWFERFVQEVREYRRKKGLEGDICLLQNRKEQGRLEDWAEFQYWEHKKADRLVEAMERAAEAKKISEGRVQAVIDEGQPADEVERLRELGLYIHEARRGTAEIELQRQAVLLKWIAEQISIIASECRMSDTGLESQDSRQPSSIITNLGKRKRLVEEPAHVKDSRCKVEFADPASIALSHVINTDNQAPTTEALPQRKSARRSNISTYQGSQNPHQEDNVFIGAEYISKASRRGGEKSSPKPANPSRVNKHAKRDPVQTRCGRLSDQAESKTSVLTAASASKHGVLHQAHSSRVSEAETRDRQARGRQVKLSVQGDKQERIPRRQSRLGEPLGKVFTKRTSTGPRARMKRTHASNLVRRSERISLRPAVHYF